ncbi:metal-dependent hydrolase [Sphingopyxis sp. BSNA05]|uniref:metal-dependent hydrolase n=1 Tax=Sphingopyxis sp. BSNA05 TaxID=1236614 RepID=UPI0020B7808E|nr:metal-dependent hydrolase [Sphingopyxis sp. BSNA05]
MDIAPTIADSATNFTARNKSATPADLHIQPRNLNLASAEINRRRWVGGDPFASAFFNALSVTFPEGELFFIDSLKKFIKHVPPKLRGEIRAFIQQEAIHSREHHSFNEHLKDCDFDITLLEEAISRVVTTIRAKPDHDQLVATMCIEHITAILAAEVIGNPAHLKDADEDQRNLWLWHASEEIEHKGVAYDTWLHMTRDWNPLKCWLGRCSFMARISFGFAKNRTRAFWNCFARTALPGCAPTMVSPIMRWSARRLSAGPCDRFSLFSSRVFTPGTLMIVRLSSLPRANMKPLSWMKRQTARRLHRSLAVAAQVRSRKSPDVSSGGDISHRIHRRIIVRKRQGELDCICFSCPAF